MEPSPELKDLLLRYYQAAAAGDAAFLEAVQSRRPGVLLIGTDPDEWWADAATIAQAWRGQLAALGGAMPIAAGPDPQAWQAGDVGWVADRPEFRFPGQPDAPFRLTAVFHREDGAWKLVQAHASLGVANEEVAGQELPTG